MQRVLRKDLWTEVRKLARASSSREVAISYVTRDLVGFRRGDTLVVDASTLAIKNGETDAPLLRKLHKKGVQVYDWRQGIALVSGRKKPAQVGVCAGIFCRVQTSHTTQAGWFLPSKSMWMTLVSCRLHQIWRPKGVHPRPLLDGRDDRSKVDHDAARAARLPDLKHPPPRRERGRELERSIFLISPISLRDLVPRQDSSPEPAGYSAAPTANLRH